MYLYCIALHLGIKSVELFFQLRFRQKLTRAGQKRLEERPFPRCQLNGLAVAKNAVCGKVDIKRPMRDDRVGVAAIATGDRADPR